MEPVLLEGTKQLQMVREALELSDLEEKLKKKLKVYAAGEKNREKKMMQVPDQNTKYLGL